MIFFFAGLALGLLIITAFGLVIGAAIHLQDVIDEINDLEFEHQPVTEREG